MTADRGGRSDFSPIHRIGSDRSLLNVNADGHQRGRCSRPTLLYHGKPPLSRHCIGPFVAVLSIAEGGGDEVTLRGMGRFLLECVVSGG